MSTRGSLAVIGRIVVASLGYAVASAIGGGIAQSLGLPAPEMALRAGAGASLATAVVAGLVIGLVLGPLSQRLALPTAQRALVLFGMLYGVNSFINVIEAIFFTTIATAEALFTLVTTAISHLILAVLVAVLFRPASVNGRLRAEMAQYVGRRRMASWVWRLGLAGVLYVPIYFFFGSLAYPFVRPFYEDAALGLGLQVPGFEVMLPLEVVRGLLFVAAAFPLIALLRLPRRAVALWIGASLAMLGGVAPMVQATWFPLTMRVVHGLEITADSLVHGFAMAGLLVARPGHSRARGALSENAGFEPRSPVA